MTALDKPQRAPRIERRADRVWKRMAEMFRDWRRTYGEEPSQMWMVGIDCLSDEEIMRGLSTAATNTYMPRSLAEFMGWCKPPSKPRAHQQLTHETHVTDSDRAHGREMLEKAKRVVREGGMSRQEALENLPWLKT